jgi:hypothetical protein
VKNQRLRMLARVRINVREALFDDQVSLRDPFRLPLEVMGIAREPLS